jgi:RND family efflux transporter MFP subunit
VGPRRAHPGAGALPAALLPAIAVLLLAAACGRTAPAPEPGPVAPVRVRTVPSGGAGPEWVEVPGTVEAVRSAGLASRFSAIVEEVRAEEGGFARAGDLLVRLDGRDLRARLEAAEAGLRAARAHRDRLRGLHEKGAATRQEMEAAEAADAAALAERDAARAQVEYVDLKAPFDGFITEKRVRAGDLTLPGQTLLSLQGTGRLRIAATVSKAQAGRLRRGQAVEAVLEDGATATARLSVVSPAGDPASRRFLVKADLPSGSGARAGSFARLRLPRDQAEPLVLVPKSALVERGALTGLFVVEEGRARLRWISPGEEAGDAIEVRAGLAAGETVIVAPAGLKDGTPVETAPPQGPAPGAPATGADRP